MLKLHSIAYRVARLPGNLEDYVQDGSTYFSYTYTQDPHRELIVSPSPRNSSTPIGVYAYTSKTVAGGPLGFASDRPFVFVLRARNPEKILKLADVTESDYLHYASEIEKIVEPGQMPKIEMWLAKYGNQIPASSTPGGKLYYLACKAHKQEWKNDEDFRVQPSSNSPAKPAYATWLFTRLGFEGIEDVDGILYSGEPEQVCFFSTASFDVVDIVNNPKFKPN